VIATGFLNPDDSIMVVLHNMSYSGQSFNLEIDGALTEYRISPYATVSLVINETT